MLLACRKLENYFSSTERESAEAANIPDRAQKNRSANGMQCLVDSCIQSGDQSRLAIRWVRPRRLGWLLRTAENGSRACWY